MEHSVSQLAARLIPKTGALPRIQIMRILLLLLVAHRIIYGIANNTSAAGTTVQTVAKGNAARVHTVWDISGDHTGAANTARGNNPCNLSAPISSTNPCGYMLVVNAAYRTDLAFNFSVSGACPNTYYEISGWFKNVCYKCGCDSLGRGATSGSVLYIPTAPGDSRV